MSFVMKNYPIKTLLKAEKPDNNNNPTLKPPFLVGYL